MAALELSPAVKIGRVAKLELSPTVSPTSPHPPPPHHLIFPSHFFFKWKMGWGSKFRMLKERKMSYSISVFSNLFCILIFL